MRELTFGELKTALLCCTVYRTCDNCPLYAGSNEGVVSAGDQSCTGKLLAASMNCINAMEADLASMASLAKRWEQQCLDREAEIFELHSAEGDR